MAHSHALQEYYKEHGPFTKRFVVFDRSLSAHCCFEATIVDLTKFKLHHQPSERQPYGYASFETVGEFWDQETAEFVCEALNFQCMVLSDEQQETMRLANEHAANFTELETPNEAAFREALNVMTEAAKRARGA